MPHHFKQPSVFPPEYKSAMLHAKAYDTYIKHFSNRHLAEAWMRNFRYFRWCCRQAQSNDVELSALESGYAIRAKLQSDNSIKLVCNPKRLSMLIELNPWVSELAVETI